jgi:hypothetical protein
VHRKDLNAGSSTIESIFARVKWQVRLLRGELDKIETNKQRLHDAVLCAEDGA